MVDVKISGLPAAAALTGNEAIPAVQGGGNVKILVSAIRAGLLNVAGMDPPAADKSLYYTGLAWATYDLTSVGRTLLAATTQAAQRTALGAAASGANTDITSISVDDLVLNGVTRLTLQVAGGTTTGPRITSYPASNPSFPGNIYYDLPVSSSQMLIGLYAGSVKNLRAYATGITWISDRVIVDNPANNVRPNTSNSTALGASTAVWSNLYVQNAPIVGSDERLKTEPRPLSEAERKAGSKLARLPAIWEWLTGDRLHAGPTVQAAMAVMSVHGLDPFAYSFICYDEWEAEPEQWHEWPARDALLDDDGTELEPAVEAGRELMQRAREAGNRYSFRKEELLCFMVSALAAESDAMASKVEALDARLMALESDK
ncbi:MULTISPECIES: tail fiber domain-containing protein [Stenotrophomonas]|nr:MULTISPECIES: tail fiber domain-containing protein [Stenotrophomonas]MBH1459910.1 tail fiber domain-containing protein [Stenotrophomonas maltophilia]MDG2507712.1 tail fiber domain-containing protein [Stenotrophomonas maltophilia]MDH0186525.1 tail fiber domain-containing protein [Stenotrophomonas sp. GD04051]MDH0462501.1 tail fiber domain-containing protein [Stenotrophomonas sp. GD03993]MDH0875245.1 tail fiber domain-containing protein [Stenotrophomonas sp. GD03877]